MNYFVTNINDYSDSKIEKFYEKVYTDKKKRLDKYVDKKERKKSIIAEIMLSDLLKETGIKYSNLNFSINDNNKPYEIDNKIYFSISHSDNYIAVCISNKEIGIDIEENKNYDYKVLKTFALDNEIEYISNSKEKDLEYMKLFTLKEAYIKCKGLRLFNIKDLNVVKEGKLEIDGHKIYSFNNDDYVISICEKKE